MAKVKSAGLRNYVGRLGGNVYYMLNGQNIGRELAPEVSNPRSTAQMRQRMQWANLVNTYRLNQPWMGKLSFENKKQTQSDYNAFMSANVGVHPVYLTKQQAEAGRVILAPYTMTKGTLPTINMSYDGAEVVFTTDIALGNYTIDENSTVANLSDAIIGNNAGWREGDQLSVILSDVVPSIGGPRASLYAGEIILNTNDTTPLANIPVGVLTMDQVLTNTRDTVIDINVEAIDAVCACCVVQSRTVSGKTSVSTQAYVLASSAQTEFDNAQTNVAFNHAADSYGLTDEPFLSSLEGSGGGSTEQAIRLVNYAGSNVSSFDDALWTSPDVFPAILTITMANEIGDAQGFISVGGIILPTPVVNGRTLTTSVTEDDATYINSSTGTNRKVIVTLNGIRYEWQ